MLVRFGLKIGNVKIGSMFLYILHGAIVKHGQRFIHTASSVNPTIVQKGARMWHILMPKPTHRAAFHSLLPISPGQKAVPCKAKKSVANFKLREGMTIGAKVTLRGETMYEFLDRLFNIALPRVRDFRGINPNGFDGRGNYNMGLREQLLFPEIDYDKIDKVRGMDICFVTTANTDEEARELLTQFNMPFAK